ncbi:MAG: phosphoserine phosphatase SerB [Proteobacteria bacterium]|nr:MAG: phosphoserine phosphatase SerB [Pseudomonadota bacterium]
MPAYKLIFDSRDHSAFSALGTASALPGNLSLIQFESLELAADVRETILRINQGSRTAFIIPVREYKAIFYDMDSTVIAEESINELSRAAGKEAEVALITEQAMAGLLDFTSALKERVRMLKDLPDSVIDEVRARLTINPGMTAVSQAAKARGIQLYLVSGGFNSLASRVVRELEFDGFIANELDSENGQLNGQLRGAIINAEAKAEFLTDTCKRSGFHVNETITVGDGANDLPMMQASGASIGYNPKSVLLPHIFGAIFTPADHAALIHAL